MRFLLLFLLTLLGTAAMTQDSWKVCFDKKNLLETSEENEEKNLLKISAADLKKYKSFIISYTETEPQKGWRRTIAIYDTNDKELSKQTGNKLTLKSSTVKNLLQTSKTLKIYTVSLPTDPNLAAQIRVRRVHLCTLVLE